MSGTWPPFVDVTDNPRVAVDLVEAALARAGFVAETEVAPIEIVMQELRAGTVAGTGAVWPSDARADFLLYSDPYLENRLMLVGRSGGDVSAESFEQLAGKKIGIVAGFAYGPELDNAKGPVFVRQESTDDNLHSLLRGELDYVLTDALVMHHLEQHHPRQTQDKLSFGTHTLIKRTLHLALRKDLPDAPRILAGFNDAISKMLRDGSYHQALHVDWIEADIDEDGYLEYVAAGDRVGNQPPSKGYRLVGVAGTGDSAHRPPARFVIKGVPYDTWDAVPNDYKGADPMSPLGKKPATLRVRVFEY